MKVSMWNDTEVPLAYFISFRTYGTWLPGDSRGTIDRFHNRYRSPYARPNPNLHRYNLTQLTVEPLILGAKERKCIDEAVRETCRIRGWLLHAANVRTNHVHVVAAAQQPPKAVLSAFKANATRSLRENGYWPHTISPWAFKGSKRKLWNEKSVARAIDYVLNGQGADLPDFDED